MKKIAFVNQRYGIDIVGGSETYARTMAEQIQNEYKDQLLVEVLTSKATDFKTWKDDYPEDIENINGVTVRRFKVKHNRSRVIQRGAKILKQIFHFHPIWLEELRLKGRGPYTEELIEYIKAHKDEYAAFIFVTYMYYPTYFGAKEVYDKAFFVPTAHDEEPIYMDIYKNLFNAVKGIIYLTDEEQNFCRSIFENHNIPQRVLGMGIEVPLDANAGRFRKKYHIEGDYIIYAGRIVKEKGCEDLIHDFISYKKDFGGKLKLVLMGKSLIDIPKCEDIIYVGFVPDEDKYDAMCGAKVICLPSQYESFSISLLEGMAYGHPGLVNGKCEVLKGHIDKSNGGSTYTDCESFKHELGILLSDDINEKLGQNAAKYVTDNYSWKELCHQFVSFILSE